jgi:hypothetical protein
VYNYHDSRAYGYKWSGILPGFVGVGLVSLWVGINLGEICQVRQYWIEIGHESKVAR